MSKLTDKIALVSGGTTGIGAAAAKLFRDEGATVVVTGSNPSTLETARRDLEGIEVVASDAANLDAIQALVGRVKDAHGRIDLLFINAGVGAMGPADEITEADYDRMFAVNTKGAFFLARETARVMPDGGAIVLLSSISGAMGLAGQSAYSATKAALSSFGRTLAGELASRNIRVNSISPGPVITPMWSKITGLEGEQLAEMQKSVGAVVPLGRPGQPEEIAAAALFLGSSDASYITGVDLPVDGGWLELGRPMH
ncbi:MULTISPECIES: SDR family oxidoreductase [unclassified Sphingomonas]|uniref:SDR family NAD(P)-dependent oxidoreductase n=1 Tax=unclassified Sphingomonas TaxID=196159 RepID=UPI00226A303A|nr:MULTISPECIES: SDR family oxidoreductase [unclassified Sphingomonas]